MNNSKIKREIYKSFKPFMKPIRVYRNGLNAYKEKTQNLFVGNIQGFYSRGKNLIVKLYKTTSDTNINYNEILSCMINEESLKINIDDYFILNNIKYQIIDIQNNNNFYLDLTLNRSD